MFNKKSTYIEILLFFTGIILIILSSSISFLNIIDDLHLNKEGSENILKARDANIVNIKLSFIGDSLLASFKGENYPGNFRDLLEKKDYNFPYKNISNIFMEDDYTIANGENVFTDNNLVEIEKDHSPAYWYKAPSRFANIYKESSIEVVSVMNNHSYDYGSQGLNDTIKALTNANLIVGSEKPVILEKDNVKIALLCINLFSEFQYENCVNDIKKIKDSVNYVIIYFHGGTEYLYKPNDNIIRYSRGFIDSGADLVIGSHPHVLEPIEKYNGKTIVYSLGSYLFGGTKSLVNRTIIYQRFLEFNLDTSELQEDENIIPCYLYTKSDDVYESWVPSIITNEEEKQKVIDFMNNKVDEPI